MMDCLFLSPASKQLADNRLYWQPVEGAGHWLDLEQAGLELAGRPLALILPGEWLSACAIVRPTSKARWMRQAVQYAVEEHLAEDVEQLHMALGAPLEDGRVRVLAIRRSLLSSLLEAAETAGLQIAAIHADYDLLPAHGQQVLLAGERGLLGGAGEQRLIFPAADWALLEERLGEVELNQADDPFPLLAAQRGTATDLAQGDFAIQRGSGQWQPWRPVAALLGLWLCLQVLFDIGQVVYLNRQGDQFAAQTQTLYQQLFPEDRRIVNLKAQFDEHLAQASSRNDERFLGSLQRVAGIMGAAPLTVEQVSYSQVRGDLALQLRAGDFAALEQVRQRLIEAGLPAQLGSANREEQGVTARLVIGGDA